MYEHHFLFNVLAVIGGLAVLRMLFGWMFWRRMRYGWRGGHYGYQRYRGCGHRRGRGPGRFDEPDESVV
jgi:hypothetical protein